MNKQKLVDKSAEGAKLTKKDAGAALDATVPAIMDAVKAGDTVTLVGFGTFKQTKRTARKGRNPQTGKEIRFLSLQHLSLLLIKLLKKW